MWPFQRKPKVAIEEFCRDFYERQIYHATIRGIDLTAGYWDAILEDLASDSLIDSSKVDVPAFHKEMMAIYFEVFGLAWAHAHRDRDNYILPQLAFTKSYLEEKGELAIWHTMGEYSKAAAQSAVAIATGERSFRARAIYMNTLKARLFDKWVKAGIEGTCAARAANHLDTAGSWRKGLTRHFLVEALVSRLEWQTEAEARFRLGAIILGLYEGGRKSIKSVSVQP